MTRLILWVVCVFATLAAAGNGYVNMAIAESAPQQAAAAAEALFVAVLPYILARSADAIAAIHRERAVRQKSAP